MSVTLKILKQKNLDVEIFKKVKATGNALLRYLNQQDVLALIAKANRPGNSSSTIQNIFIEKAKELGFESEARRLFEDMNLRPDYYKPIGNSGIIIEVERGKTIMNNMDMLDMWKCHILTSSLIMRHNYAA